ncbi:hypothetical protein BOTBODRAFT_143634 [Botryobasidium botryosum FD-172 SS1]|uniref:Peptidase S28 n=1 Tax=Botryobasidium botryosum (strain FD-172 SS1) TaxID=930990 RepID=A0A067MQ77_BOTB1|nr:hypothetical protein BOTBODRAFT_143634 [Botryobasidium botryosum FD-172 SS1]
MLCRYPSLIAVLFLPVVAEVVFARPQWRLGVPPVHPPVDPPSHIPMKDGVLLPPYDTIYTFDQLIDHDNPRLGTFKQRYYFTHEFYRHGGPIVISTPGEGPLDGYAGFITNATLNGVVAQATKGAAVMIEHRFFGESNPYSDLSEESYRVHTLEQAIEDLVYFAQTAVLPMPGGNSVGASKAPWFLFGGSYSGALGYFEPIREHMPKNCSADVERVIRYMDRTLAFGSQLQKEAFKARFGMSGLTHLDDVAATLVAPFNPWQDLSPKTGSNNTFVEFCDALEVRNGIAAPADGWGLSHSLAAFGNWMKGFLAQTPVSARISKSSISPSETQAGLGSGFAAIILRQCSNYFPKTFPSATSARPKTEEVNAKYGGWSTNAPRIFFANGKRDPWREATVSSDFINRSSTRQNPIAVSDGFHCNDLDMANAIDPTIAKVQEFAVRYFVQWMDEYRWSISPLPPTFYHEKIPADIIDAPPSPLSNFLSQL